MEELTLGYMIQVAGAVVLRVLAMLVKFLPIVIVVLVVLYIKRRADNAADERAAREFRERRGK